MNDLFEKLFSRLNQRGKDLTPVYDLDAKLGFPHKSFKTVHVGGTNGKGSVARKMAKALEFEGFKVGLYTSPHIRDVRERIQINEDLIPLEDFRRHLDQILPMSLNLGFFDIITAIAFCYFKERKVDWAVIEVGLGGAYDATNVIFPEIAIITSIGMDHMELLGNSLQEIATEKGGIAKRGIPLVTGPTAAPFFLKSIQVEGAPFFDLENQQIAKKALEILLISQGSIEKGIKTRPPCRFEVRGNVILDVAHNPDGFRKLLEALQLHFPSVKKFHFIVAFSKTKDWKSCLEIIIPFAATITVATIDKERMERAEVIRDYLPSVSISSCIETSLKTDGWNVICGSFYLMDQALLAIASKEKRALLDDLEIDDGKSTIYRKQ